MHPYRWPEHETSKNIIIVRTMAAISLLATAEFTFPAVFIGYLLSKRRQQAQYYSLKDHILTSLITLTLSVPETRQ